MDKIVEGLDFDDVLIVPCDTSYVRSRSYVDLDRVFELNGYLFKIKPIVASNMDGVGTLSMASVLTDHAMLTCLTKNTPIDQIRHTLCHSELLTAVSIGVCNKSYEILNDLQKYERTIDKPIWFNIDIANGHCSSLADMVAYVRDMFSDSIIIAGNVVTHKAVEILAKSGANVVKVGIGSGSACTTRLKTGVGYPQLSTIMNCIHAAHDNGAYLMSDGGCKNAGDVAKALVAGADFVMLGGMLAGHAESEGDILENESGKMVVEFHGMSSTIANQSYSGGLKNYRTSEGREMLIPYRGHVRHTVEDICGGLRSACTYTNSTTIRDLRRANFVRTTQQYNRVFAEYSI